MWLTTAGVGTDDLAETVLVSFLHYQDILPPARFHSVLL